MAGLKNHLCPGVLIDQNKEEKKDVQLLYCNDGHEPRRESDYRWDMTKDEM